MWIRRAIYFAYNLGLSACAGVGATYMLGGTEWAALIGLVVGVVVMAEIGRGFSLNSFLDEIARRRVSVL